MNDDRRQQSDWVPDKTFENDEFAVQVNKLPLRWPRFSLTINAKGKDGKLTRFLAVRANGQGKVAVQPFADSIASLLRDVEGYVEKQLQAVEDSSITMKQDREFKNISKDHPKQQKGLKQWGKHDKIKRDMRESERTREG
jgi:hypothetical protein